MLLFDTPLGVMIRNHEKVGSNDWVSLLGCWVEMPVQPGISLSEAPNTWCQKKKKKDVGLK
jgi:hypothetical protein